MTTPAPHPARLGRYAIEGVIGEGAMGIVYRGFDPEIGRTVAIKTIHRALTGDAGADSMLARFRNEARAVGRLSHPGVVQVHDIGEEDGLTFIAMEFVDGCNLAQLLVEGEPWPLARTLSTMEQLLDALEAAHQAGVWHRDIKPANLLVRRDGRLKVTDFGIARIENQGLTRTSSAIGTPGWMAPEQYLGDTIDQRVDLYAAGVLLYRLLSGRAPFSGGSEAQMYQALHGTPTAPSHVDGSRSPPAFDTLVLAALARAPSDRPANAAAFRQALRDAAAAPTTAGSAAARDADATVVRPGSGAASAATRVATATTGPVSVATAPREGPLTDAMLATVEAALATQIGPMARVLLRREAPNAPDLHTLIERLSNRLDAPGERAAFVAQATAGATRAGRGTGTRAPVTPLPGARPAATSGTASPAWTPDHLQRAEQWLAQRIGPIAKLLVKRAASRSTTLAGFEVELLAQAGDGIDAGALHAAIAG